MRPTHKNIMLPGIGCRWVLPNKRSSFASWSKQNLIGSNSPLPMSEMAVTTNDKMPCMHLTFWNHFFNSACSLKDKKVIFLGFLIPLARCWRH
jgi:hypothetical protein